MNNDNESLDQIPPLRQKSEHSFKIQKPAILLIIVILIAIITGTFGYLMGIKNKNTSQNIQKTSIKQQPTITSSNIASTSIPVKETNIKPKRKSWVLKKINKGISSVVFSLCSHSSNCVAQWKDWLFYVVYEPTTNSKNKPGYNNIKINGYNLLTNQTVNIYDVSKNINDFKDTIIYENQKMKEEITTRPPGDIYDMQVIGDTLYFSVGGYLKSGGLFWISLPPISKPQKFANIGGVEIKYWKDRYWIIGEFGDGCFSETNYSLLDLTSKKITPIADSSFGCTEGEEYIAIDKKDNMILAYHAWDPLTPVFDKSGYTYYGNYQYVVSVPFDNPTAKKEIIPKQDMPKNITEISYLEDADQLLLKGDKNYIFDFSFNTLKIVNETPPILNNTPQPTNEKTFEEVIKEIKLPPEYKFELE